MKPAVYSFVACGRRREVRKWSSLGPCKAKADVPAPASEKQLATCAINLNHGYMSIENKALLGFVWQKMSSPQIDVDWRRHVFASALPLETLQLVHGAIKLPIQMSFVAEEYSNLQFFRAAAPGRGGTVAFTTKAAFPLFTMRRPSKFGEKHRTFWLRFVFCACI
jgi:hypothetical protein